MPHKDPEKRKIYKKRYEAKRLARSAETRRAARVEQGLPPDPTPEEKQALMAAMSAKGVEAPRSGLPVGAVRAISVMRHRLPADASPEMVEVAGYAFSRMVDVLAGKVSFRKAPSVLKAAVETRAELCGPIQQKVEMSGGVSLEMLVARAAQREDQDPVPALPDGSAVQ